MLVKKRMLSALAAITVCGSGCMTFNGGELPRRSLPGGSSYVPVVSTEVGEIALLHNNDPGGMKPPMSAHGIGNRELTAVLSRWKGRKLIRDYGPPGKLDDEPDYNLKITGRQNEQSSLFASFVTGFTMFLFPSSATVEGDWSFELTNKRTGESFVVPTKNSVTMWMHLIFLPGLPVFFMGQYRADSDVSAYVYDEFVKQGAWRGSSRP